MSRVISATDRFYPSSHKQHCPGNNYFQYSEDGGAIAENAPSLKEKLQINSFEQNYGARIVHSTLSLCEILVSR